MKKNPMGHPARLAALVLALSLLAGCGADTPAASPTPDPAPGQSEAASPAPNTETPEPTAAEPTESPEPDPTGTPEPTAAPTSTPEPTPAPTPALTPTPAPTPEPTQAPEPTLSVPEDGTYTAGVTLAGGSGRASIQSPAVLRCSGGQFYATIVWSSPNYDYMKVNGVRYDPVSAPGENSVFEIPVAAFDTALPVIADTVAMSEPHEVEYTITVTSASLTKQ